jgi:TonB family protein
MSTLSKLTAILFLACVPLWSQSDSPSAQQGDSNPPASQPSQTSPDQPSAAPQDSTKLEPIRTVKAAYPLEARDKQLQGQVWVKIQVSETGDVESAELISGDPVLAKSAIEAVKQWKFKPFIKNGKPISVSSKLPFSFAFSGNIRDEEVPTDTTAAIKRVRVSKGVSQGLLVYRVQPVYPLEARREGIQGQVILRAVISKEGRISGLTLISGPKELAPAAIGAVEQWRYKPYLLMGDPVEVDTEILVNFTLSPR